MRHFLRKYYFLLSCILLTSDAAIAQENEGCLTMHQLIKMQTAALNDIRLFLYGEEWTFMYAESGIAYTCSNGEISFDLITWEKPTYYNRDIIQLYISQSEQNLVAYESSQKCFNRLLTSLKELKGNAKVIGDDLVTTFYEKNSIVELIEYKSVSSDNRLSVMVYNQNSLLREAIDKGKEGDSMDVDRGLGKSELRQSHVNILNQINQSGGGGSDGSDKGPGNQSNPDGKIEGKGVFGGRDGNGWELSGRSMLGNPKLNEKPTEEGKVVLRIYVDKNGKVTKAVPLIEESNTASSYLFNLAQKAALSAKFNVAPDAPASQSGKMTFNFKLR